MDLLVPLPVVNRVGIINYVLILDQDTMRTYWSRKIYVDESQQQYSIHVTHILLAKFSVVVIRGIVHNDSIMFLR